MRKSIFLLLCFLTACKPFAFSVPPPTAEPITVNLPPDLAWMQDSLHVCATAHPEAAVFIQAGNIGSLQGADITLSLGAPSDAEKIHATLLGQERIILIANPTIKINLLDVTAIRSIYRTYDPQWDAWAYPAGNLTQQIFSDVFLEGETLSSHVRLAPTPAAMLEAIVENANAIGYIPQAWLTDDVQTIALDAEIEDALAQPILGFTHGAPEGITRALLGCLQETLQP